MGTTKFRLALTALIAPLLAPFHAAGATDDDHAHERRQMVAAVAAMARATAKETGRDHLDERVMDAMAKVPRHRLPALRETARAVAR